MFVDWRLLRVAWTASRSNQSVLKEINPEYSLEGLMLKLKLQYFSHLMQRTDSLEKTLMLGKIEGRRRRGRRGWNGWMISPVWWTWVWVGSGSWWWTGKPITKSQTWLSNWTDITYAFCLVSPRPPWLFCVFVAVHGLSLVVASRGYSSVWGMDFSLWWLLLFQSTVSECTGFSSFGSHTLELGLSSCGTWA